MKLLISQKNQLFSLIETEIFFNPNQFNISEHQSEEKWITTIGFKNSEYYFKFFDHPEYYNSCYVNYCPAENKFLEGTGNISFEEGKLHFTKWLHCLHNEVSEPNLWGNFTKSVENFNSLIYTNNSKFSAKEYVDLQNKMEILLTKISSLPLVIEQQNEIKQELNRITELALDLGKFD